MTIGVFRLAIVSRSSASFVGLGRLVEQHVHGDGARLFGVERLQQIGEKGAIDRRAVGKELERVLVDRGDDDAAVLRLGRQQGRDPQILDEALRLGEEGDIVRHQDGERRGQHRDAGRDQQPVGDPLQPFHATPLPGPVIS